MEVAACGAVVACCFVEGLQSFVAEVVTGEAGGGEWSEPSEPTAWVSVPQRRM